MKIRSTDERKSAMINKHGFFAGLCAAIMCAVMISANASDADDTVLVEADADHVRSLGRTCYTDDALWLANSASGVEFTVQSPTVGFELTDQGDASRIAIFVNGELREDRILEDYYSYIEIETGPGENTVRFLKLSEAQYSTLGIDSIILPKDGKISPTKPKQRKMEFIGDSITCGYGIDLPMYDPDTGDRNDFSTETENVTKTYAYLTAEHFDADINILSASGYGVYISYSGMLENTLTNWYEQYSVDANDPYYFSDGTCLEERSWDFSSYQPDCVVINLGTNDWLYLQNHDKDAEFEESYISLLTKIRQNNPNAVIFCTMGLMGDELFANMESAVEAYKTSNSDDKVYTLKFAQMDLSSEGLAVNSHPTDISNRRAAEQELIPLIEEKMNWQDRPEEPVVETEAVIDETPTNEAETDTETTVDMEEISTHQEDGSMPQPDLPESSEVPNPDKDAIPTDSIAFKVIVGMASFTLVGGAGLLLKLRK